MDLPFEIVIASGQECDFDLRLVTGRRQRDKQRYNDRHAEPGTSPHSTAWPYFPEGMWGADGETETLTPANTSATRSAS